MRVLKILKNHKMMSHQQGGAHILQKVTNQLKLQTICLQAIAKSLKWKTKKKACNNQISWNSLMKILNWLHWNQLWKLQDLCLNVSLREETQTLSTIDITIQIMILPVINVSKQFAALVADKEFQWMLVKVFFGFYCWFRWLDLEPMLFGALGMHN